MRSFSKKVPYKSRSDIITVYPLGDLHLGHVLCAEDAFRETIEQIASDPLAYWIGLGDMTECITRKDFRHLESHYAEWLHGEDDVIEVQRKRLIKLLEPIAPKCLGYLRGNHEDKLLQHDGRDIYHSVAEELIKMGATAPLGLGTQGFVRLYLQRINRLRTSDSWPVIVYATHGWGGGRLEGSLPLKLGRLLKSYHADLYLFGHHHRAVPLRSHRVSMKTASDELQGLDVYAIGTGSFLRGYDPNQEGEVYSESKGYPPQPLGCPVIEIVPDKRSIRVTI